MRVSDAVSVKAAILRVAERGTVGFMVLSRSEAPDADETARRKIMPASIWETIPLINQGDVQPVNYRTHPGRRCSGAAIAVLSQTC